MKIGINTGLWQWPFDNSRVDLFKKIEDLGFDGVEMTINDKSQQNIEKIRDSLKKTKLIPIICSSFIEGNLLSENKADIDRGIKHIKESIDLCEYLGSNMLVGPTYGSYINVDFLEKEIKKKAEDQCIDLLRQMGNLAKTKKVRIAVEPLNRCETNFINTSAEGVDLVKKIGLDNVGLNLDTYHMNIEEKNSVEATLYAEKYLFHLHVPENDRGTPGTGHVDWKGIADSLSKINFNDFIVMESFSPEVIEVAKLGSFWRVYDYPSEEMAIKGIDFLRKTFG